MTEQTSEAVAKLAARGLVRPESLTSEEVRRIAASCLTQARPKKSVADRVMREAAIAEAQIPATLEE